MKLTLKDKDKTVLNSGSVSSHYIIGTIKKPDKEYN